MMPSPEIRSRIAEAGQTQPSAPATAAMAPVPTDPSKTRHDGSEAAPRTDIDRNELVRRMAAILGNVAVLTALLVYFGWVRSEVQSRLLGIDESVLGMTTRDYLLRSVRSVLVLLLVIAVAGLLWLLADRPLVRRLRRCGTSDTVVRWVLRLLPAALVLLPVSVWVAGFFWPAPMYIAFPLSVAAGLLLLVYSIQLRQLLPGAEPTSTGREVLLRAFTAIIVGIGLFSTTANYATVEGTRLADEFINTLDDLPSVIVYSADRLQIDIPGSAENQLPATDSAYKFRYSGFRLLEHTGGHYFLVTDAWNPQSGTVIMLADNTPMRIEFVRRRGP
jgi:hypothetical protein